MTNPLILCKMFDIQRMSWFFMLQNCSCIMTSGFVWTLHTSFWYGCSIRPAYLYPCLSTSPRCYIHSVIQPFSCSFLRTRQRCLGHLPNFLTPPPTRFNSRFSSNSCKSETPAIFDSMVICLFKLINWCVKIN